MEGPCSGARTLPPTLSVRVCLPSGHAHKSPPLFSRLAAKLKSIAGDPRLRELLLWCLPALLAGFILRAVITWQLPLAFLHDDSPDFLTTADELFRDFDVEFHGKKTFLSPSWLTLPFFLPFPALRTLPFFQHALGLCAVFLVGALVRLWLRAWRWWIIPLTLAMALNPAFPYYEHTFMAEPLFVFCFLLVAVAGTLYTLRPSHARFAFLSLALVLLAGSRPEGKLLFGFGLLLVALLRGPTWRERESRVQLIALPILAVVTHFITLTSQAGLLLYVAVARLTPVEPKCAPGFEPFIAPWREQLQARWEQEWTFPSVRDRKKLSAILKDYLRARLQQEKVPSSADAELSMALARETCLRNLSSLPGIALAKFAAVSQDPPGSVFSERTVFTKQLEMAMENAELLQRLGRKLAGHPIDTEEQIAAFVNDHYRPLPWFEAWRDRWMAAVNHFRLPDRLPPAGTPPFQGVPWYFLLAAAGLVAIALRPGELQRFHIAWGLTLLGFFFVIMLTANIRPRFRIAFEPLWFLYIALLVETVARAFATLRRRR